MLDKMLGKYGIDKCIEKKITGFESIKVNIEDGSVIESDLTMFIPAVNEAPYLRNSDLPLSDAGFVKIDDYCQVQGFENVFAVGDVAALEGPEWKAKQGHLAVIM